MERGENTERPSDRSSPPPPAGWGYLTLAATAAAGYGVAYLLDQTAPVDVDPGAYGAALMVFIAGTAGYVARTAEARVRRSQAADIGQVTGRLAELTSQVAQLTSQVEQLRGMVAGTATEAPRPKATGHACVSTTHGGTVRIARSAVDPDTDPTGLSLQRAREEGIEQGFDIGLRTQLADLGVPTLPRPRRPRLTGDS